MAQNYDKTDLLWTSRGDYFLDDQNDLMDTSGDPLRSLVQEIHTQSESDQGDWVVFENVGANLRDYVGEPNTPTTAESIKTRLLASVTRNGLVNNRDVKITYMPIDHDKILFRIAIEVMPTAENGNSDRVMVTMLYNYSNNNVYHIR